MSVSGNTDSGTIDFTNLSESEQRDVAARLLRIKESGWRPFWCKIKDCTGDPHPARDRHGRLRKPKKDEPWAEHFVVDGVDRYILDVERKKIETSWVRKGRVALDPQWAHNHARQDQRLPAWMKPWVLFIMSGRGSGKTRTGTEFVTLSARRGLDGAIIGRRGTELINTHVKALIEHAHPDFMPEYSPSKDLITWPNGAITYLFSAERPENIRSVNLSYFWMDEAAFMPEVRTAWMNAKMATRIETPGNPIHVLITSTPTSTKWVMEMEDDEDIEIRRVSTYANRVNLSKDFIAALEKEYEGTRMGRQEIHGEVLRDVEGALWNDDMFIHERRTPTEFIEALAEYDMRIVAIDPAGSKGPRSDATGIIGVGTIADSSVQTFDVLVDGTLKGSPTEWARRAFAVARMIDAQVIVAEKNFGGDMVKQVLKDFAEKYPAEARNSEGGDFLIKVRHAVKSKETRAESTVAKYEQGRVRHIVTVGNAFGDMGEIEKEQTTWVPKNRGGKSPSPNRVDALVWAVEEAAVPVKFAATSANMATLQGLIK